MAAATSPAVRTQARTARAAAACSCFTPRNGTTARRRAFPKCPTRITWRGRTSAPAAHRRRGCASQPQTSASVRPLCPASASAPRLTRGFRCRLQTLAAWILPPVRAGALSTSTAPARGLPAHQRARRQASGTGRRPPRRVARANRARPQRRVLTGMAAARRLRRRHRGAAAATAHRAPATRGAAAAMTATRTAAHHPADAGHQDHTPREAAMPTRTIFSSCSATRCCAH